MQGGTRDEPNTALVYSSDAAHSAVPGVDAATKYALVSNGSNGHQSPMAIVPLDSFVGDGQRSTSNARPHDSPSAGLGLRTRSTRIHPEDSDAESPGQAVSQSSTREFGTRHVLHRFASTNVHTKPLQSILRASAAQSSGNDKIQRVRFDESVQEASNKTRGRSLFFGQAVQGSQFHAAWQTAMLIPLTWEMWAFAFRCALCQPLASRNTLNWVDVADVLADVCFILDGAVQCNSAQPDPDDKNSPPGAGAVLRTDKEDKLRSRSQSTMRYFMNTFPLELLPSVFYWLVSISGIPLFWFSMLLRAAPRSLRLSTYFREMAMNLSIEIYALQIFKFTLYIFMSIHYSGCIFYWLAVFYPGTIGGDPTEEQHARNNTWIAKLEQAFPPFHMSTSSLGEKYLICLYRGTLGVSNLGYHMTLPQSVQESLVWIIVMSFHACLSAFILGTMFHYLMRKDPAQEALDTLLQEVNMFAGNWSIPMRLQTKLSDFIKFQHHKGWSTSTFTLPRSMEIQVVNALFRPTIEKSVSLSGILHNCSSMYLDALLMSVREVFLMPGEEVLRAGRSSMQLAFVVSGRVEEVQGDVVRNVIRSDIDSCTSLLARSFFFGIPELYTVRAFHESDVRLLVLGIDDGEKLHREFPDQQEIIRANILRKYGLDNKARDLAGPVGDHRNGSGAAMKNRSSAASHGASSPVARSSSFHPHADTLNSQEDDQDFARIQDSLRETVKKRMLDQVHAIFHAVDRGDAEEVRRLLKAKGIEPSWADYDGKTMLHLCAAQGKYRLVEVLLEEGANKNAMDR